MSCIDIFVKDEIIDSIIAILNKWNFHNIEVNNWVGFDEDEGDFQIGSNITAEIESADISFFINFINENFDVFECF